MIQKYLTLPAPFPKREGGAKLTPPSLLGKGVGGLGLRPRPGFTLLEVLLATVIAALLLAALYAALNMTLKQTQNSRDSIEVESVSRGIFNKLTIDLSGTLAPLPPKSGGNSAESGGTTASTSTAPAASADPAAPTTENGTATPPTEGTTDPAAPAVTDNPTAVAADFLAQGGIIGIPDEKKLVIYAGRVPEAFGRYGNPGEQIRADQRQIVYQFVDGRGLFRQERPWITAEGVRNSVAVDFDSPDAVLVAEEVVEFDIEYSDGSDWVVEWDGTIPGADGVTPLGPPRALRVTMMLKLPVGKGEFIEKRVTQVIAVRSAPGTNTPMFLEAPIDGATEGTPAAEGTPTTGGSTPASGSNSGTTPKLPAGGNTGSTAPKQPAGTGMQPAGSTPSTRPGGSTPSTKPGGATGGRSGGGR